MTNTQTSETHSSHLRQLRALRQPPTTNSVSVIAGPPEPAVASLAVRELIAFPTGLRPPRPQLISRDGARRVLAEPEPGCSFCSGIWGTTLRA